MLEGRFGFGLWWGLPPWNHDGRYPMPVLTEEILRFICYGKRDSKTKRVSGGHIQDALKNGGGKKFHTEFPADWMVETVCEVFLSCDTNQSSNQRNQPKVQRNVSRGAYQE
ncbi:hypothetical protein HMPREF0578_1167 [Mobiluncus mulieris 28-1]|nr:hypothetical protein HMPREF0578_1167 [Mobiluncus mulieris 28-1]